MKLSRDELLELMALADGELDGPARQRAERLVSEREEARRAFEGMRAPAVRAWLERSFAERGSAADGVADAVMGRLASGPSALGAGDLRGEEQGVVRRPREISAARRRVRLPVAAAMGSGLVLALAAGVALLVRASREHAPVARVVTPTVDSASASASAGGVVVDEIDSPARNVSIFQISAAAHAAPSSTPSSVVIWIEDEPGGK